MLLQRCIDMFVCACVCVYVCVCWPAATVCEKNHHEVDLSIRIIDTGWLHAKSEKKTLNIIIKDADTGRACLCLWAQICNLTMCFSFFIVLFRCYFWDAAQRNPQISLVSQIIMVDVIKSCHICVVNGLSMEAGEVKGFLKGQLTHHCCWPPLSYSYPHLLNLNQEPKVWPFISWLSSGCLFHLPAHCCITPAPSFPISPPLSQPRNTWRAALKGRNLNPSSSNTSPLLLTPSLLPETITIPPCLPAVLLSLFHFLLLPIS